MEIVSSVLALVFALAAALYAGSLARKYMFHGCTHSRCAVLDVRHFCFLLLAAFVGLIFFALEARQLIVELSTPDGNADYMAWNVLEGTYFALILLALHLFEDKFSCPRSAKAEQGAPHG